VILQHGMQRMLTEQHDEYYYITLMNENYAHPEMPEGAAEGVIRGMYRLAATRPARKKKKGRSGPARATCWARAPSCARRSRRRSCWRRTSAWPTI
jgi:pyruvate dehydrogenase complex dehydrogenase (E1) component